MKKHSCLITCISLYFINVSILDQKVQARADESMAHVPKVARGIIIIIEAQD
jgi:uncharacterized protein (UPF0332 family)